MLRVLPPPDHDQDTPRCWSRCTQMFIKMYLDIDQDTPRCCLLMYTDVDQDVLRYWSRYTQMLIFDVLRCRSRCTQMLPPPGHAQDTLRCRARNAAEWSYPATAAHRTHFQVGGWGFALLVIETPCGASFTACEILWRQIKWRLGLCVYELFVVTLSYTGTELQL